MTWQVIFNVSVVRLWFPWHFVEWPLWLQNHQEQLEGKQGGREGSRYQATVKEIYMVLSSFPPLRMSWLVGFPPFGQRKWDIEPQRVRLSWGSGGRLERVVWGFPGFQLFPSQRCSLWSLESASGVPLMDASQICCCWATKETQRNSFGSFWNSSYVHVAHSWEGTNMQPVKRKLPLHVCPLSSQFLSALLTMETWVFYILPRDSVSTLTWEFLTWPDLHYFLSRCLLQGRHQASVNHSK